MTYTWLELSKSTGLKPSPKLRHTPGHFSNIIRILLSTITLALNHITKEFRFLFHHRGGVTSTLALVLQKGVDLRSFVMGILLVCTYHNDPMRWYNAVEPHSNSESKNLQGALAMRSTKCLHYRPTFRGRATLVSSAGNMRAVRSQRTHAVQGGRLTKVRDRQETAESNKSNDSLTDFDFKPSTKENEHIRAAYGSHLKDMYIAFLKVRTLEHPKTQGVTEEGYTGDIVVKDSWSPTHRIDEASALGEVSGGFGLPTVLGWHEVASNKLFYDETTKPWYLFDSVQTEREHGFDLRCRTICYFGTEGNLLSTAKTTPRELFIAIVHAMIGELFNILLGSLVLFVAGLYILYKDKYYMHRDGSNGNLLILRGATRKDNPSVFWVTSYTYTDVSTPISVKFITTVGDKCKGCLIDGDLMRKVDDPKLSGHEISVRLGRVFTKEIDRL